MDKKVLKKVLSGLSDQNIRFEELRKLLFAAGFQERIKGDHHIYTKQNIVEIINLQPITAGKAKAYQVKQVRNLFVQYKIHEEV